MYRSQAHWLLYVSPTFILKPFAQRMHLYVLYGSQNKQELFPHTALTAFLIETECVYSAVRTETLNIIQVKLILRKINITAKISVWNFL
jgi:hypothetical protein